MRQAGCTHFSEATQTYLDSIGALCERCLRAEVAALREMVKDMNQTGAGLLTLLENPKTFETLVPADWLSRVRWGHPTVVAAYARLRDLAAARALLARWMAWQDFNPETDEGPAPPYPLPDTRAFLYQRRDEARRCTCLGRDLGCGVSHHDPDCPARDEARGADD